MMEIKPDKRDKITEELIALEMEDELSYEIIKSLINEPKAFEQVKKKLGNDFYTRIIWYLTHKKYKKNEAKKLWNDILSHKEELRYKLGRDVGIAVASLDYLSNIRDLISEAKVLEENRIHEIAHVATKDGLTGLYNRENFEILLKKKIEECKRYDQSVSLIMADLDDFKKINDTYGHQKGDDVLRSIGGILMTLIRESDLACRYGGEEMAVILPNTGKKAAYELAERIRHAVFETFHDDLQVTVSIGISGFPEDADNDGRLVKAADESLYEAKKRGKNIVVSYPRGQVGKEPDIRSDSLNYKARRAQQKDKHNQGQG